MGSTIWIGAGSGLAPFRGFWQQMALDSLQTGGTSVRSINSDRIQQTLQDYFSTCKKKSDDAVTSNPIQLIFGCKNENGNLLKMETKQLKRTTAFSRQPGKRKEYVQDIVRRKSLLIFEYLYNKGGTVYVCGKVAMAEAVTEAIIAAINKHMPKEDKFITSATEFVNEMREDGRFRQDIFGK